MSREVGSFLAGLIILAVVYVLVATQGGADMVKAIGTAVAEILRAASGQTPVPATAAGAAAA